MQSALKGTSSVSGQTEAAGGAITAAASKKEIEDLDRSVAKAQSGYENLRRHHPRMDTDLYMDFKEKWIVY
jgi:hypothetical protein